MSLLRTIAAIAATALTSAYATASYYTIRSASELSKGSWQAGDVITIANGDYSKSTFSVVGNGTEEKPIILQAATPGAVRLTDGAKLQIKGTWIEVHGLDFRPTNKATDAAINFDASSANCRVTNCRIDSYNPSEATTNIKWVNLRGTANRVDHCSFSGKASMGTLLVVWLTQGVGAGHTIDHCFFGERVPILENGSAVNGQETIRIGDSSTSLLDANCTIESNYFNHCDGEIEIISNKSCGNVYRYNTFYECAGTLTLRHGHRCTVESNAVFANRYSRSGKAGGIRIIGEDHRVVNNYLFGVDGSGFRSAISMTNGNTNPELNGYSQVKRAVVAYNTMVDCKYALTIGAEVGVTSEAVPINLTICNNLMANPSSSSYYIISAIDNTVTYTTITNNYYDRGRYSNFNKTTGLVCDPKLTLTGSNAYSITYPDLTKQRSTTGIANVTTDMFGNDRTSSNQPGCVAVADFTGSRLATPDNCGVDWDGHMSAIPLPLADSDENVVAQQFFDLNGRPVAANATGYIIRCSIYTNGAMTSKLIYQR